VLLDTWRTVFAQALETGWAPSQIVLAGKSMGGRMASLVADELGTAGLVCVGYPFHPPARSERLRTEHLRNLRTECLICQGERDPFGTVDEVSAYSLSSAITLHWAADGNHDLKPRKASGRTHDQNLAEALGAIGACLETRL